MMKTGLVTALLSAALIWTTGCDDAATPGGGDATTDGGPGGQGGGGAGGQGGGPGGAGGVGGVGGGEPTECTQDADCPEDQYCLTPEGELFGTCTGGCRTGAGSLCGLGQECDPTSRRCLCTADEACPEGQYCGDDGDCVMGCRQDPDDCPLGADGRRQNCGDDRRCEPLFVCCEGNACTETAEDACGGDLVRGALSCQQDPCGGSGCTEDSECEDERYCSIADGRCLLGCREGGCPDPNQICDPLKRECQDVFCDTDDDCIAGYYCDNEGPDATGLCRAGCRGDADCPQGQVCEDNECREPGLDCDPGLENPCGIGQYCDPNSRLCRDDCEGNDDCGPDELCADNGQCVLGCRDDGNEPNDTIETATAIALVQQGNVRVGTVEGGVICSGNVDFYAVQLEAGERLRVALNHEADPQNLEGLNLRLHGDQVEDGPIEAATLNNPEVIVYPPLNVEAPATTYYFEVYGDIEARLTYELSVVVVSADEPCFPDVREAGDGDDLPRFSTRVAQLRTVIDGSICRDDEDWFVMALRTNDGLQIELVTTEESDEVQFSLYTARSPDLVNVGNPAFRSGAPVEVPGGRAYRFNAEVGTAQFNDGEWYLRVRGIDANALADYTLTITRTPDPNVCGDDGGTEPNDSIAQAVDLDALANGRVALDVNFEVPLPLEICARDEDVFCLQSDDNEILAAWAVSDGVAGQLTLQLLDSQGRQVGRGGNHTRVGQPTDPARVLGIPAGLYCVRVDGLEAAQGPYALFVRREAGGDACVVDEAEQDQRNDSASTATPLPDVGGNPPNRRYQFESGVICDPNGADEDWYSFNIPQANSRVCVALDGFRDERADLDLTVFRRAPSGLACERNDQCNHLGGGGQMATCIEGFCAVRCQVSADCQGGESCIANRCTLPPPNYTSTSAFDFELVDIRRNILGDRNGEHLLRVFRGEAGDTEPYRITVTVSPTDDVCAPDWQERGNRNNTSDDATRLGTGQVGLCDTWICADERQNGTGDWFEVTVPAGEDRTVYIDYQNFPVEGELRLTYNDFLWDDPDNIFGGIRTSRNGIGNSQCINIQGGSADRDVYLNVFAPRMDDTSPRGRVDYGIRVVPTDLQVRDDGECVRLGADNLGACPPDVRNASDCWPTAIIP